MKNVVIGALLTIALFLIIRPGVTVQATGTCSTGRFPTCADVNADGRVDITDPVQTLSWLFLGGPEPVCCADSSQGPNEWVLNQAIPMPGRRSVGRFKDNGDGTVTDLLTGLMWQQRTGDWDRDDVIDSKDLIPLETAKTYTRSLSLAGKRDWRLPTVKELESIIDRTVFRPAIDPMFTDTKYGDGDPVYWSADLDGYPDASFVVSFNYGSVGVRGNVPENGGVPAYIRLVRNP